MLQPIRIAGRSNKIVEYISEGGEEDSNDCLDKKIDLNQSQSDMHDGHHAFEFELDAKSLKSIQY